MHDLRYQHVEKSLARLHNVQEQDIKAFRARLRNLRNLGVPELPKVGSGTQITYTIDQLHELFFALELTRTGISPAATTEIIKRNPFTSKGKIYDVVLQNPDTQYYVAVSLDLFGGEPGEQMRIDSVFFPRENFFKRVFSQFKKKASRRHLLVINFSQLLREFHEILEETTARHG